MTRIALVVAYLASIATAVVLLNASTENSLLAFVIWAPTSVILGWGTGQLGFALLAFLAMPFSVLFGHPNHSPESEPPLVLWSVGFYALISASLIFSAALMRSVVDSRRHQRSS